MRLTRLEIQGFRSFGPGAVEIAFDGEFSIIYGPNSQGKTSLAEAVEFLLTGATARREMVGSAVREFRDALRNAHLEPGHDVFVRGRFLTSDGRTVSVERRLVRDYGGQGSCASTLHVDGAAADSVEVIGLHLSPAPIAAPVLMQHTLRHVISAGPQERTGYFRALLEVSDVTAIREAIAAAAGLVAAPAADIAGSFEACLGNAPLRQALSPLLDREATGALVSSCLRDCLVAFLQHFEVEVPASEDELRTAAERLLADLRSRAFPLAGFSRRTDERIEVLTDPLAAPLSRLLEVQGATEREAVAAAAFYDELMRLPLVAEAAGTIDCPACGTVGALTPHRTAEIRESLRATATYRGAISGAQHALDAARRWAAATAAKLRRATPQFMHWSPQERDARGFTATAADALLGAQQANLLEVWLGHRDRIEVGLTRLADQVGALSGRLDGMQAGSVNEAFVEELVGSITALGAEIQALNELLPAYDESALALKAALTREIDRVQGAETWSAAATLASRHDELLPYAKERRATARVQAELAEASTAVDTAATEVLDEKFDELSTEVRRWWDLLRPGEPTSFAGVARVGEGNRFLDLSTNLTTVAPPPRTSVRSAAAVLSDSQLNCLGLSAFLARAARSGAGFVVLDDPIPASDDDHRALFVRNVLPALVDARIQVIITTHNDALRRDIQTTLDHRAFDSMVMVLNAPEVGTQVQIRSDDFSARLARAQPYMRNQDDFIRERAAAHLRKAAERLCKRILVARRRADGDAAADINDYRDGDGTLGHLIPLVLPYITDPAHAGVFRSLNRRLSPGAHDVACPSVPDTVSSYNDLRMLGEHYP